MIESNRYNGSAPLAKRCGGQSMPFRTNDSQSSPTMKRRAADQLRVDRKRLLRELHNERDQKPAESQLAGRWWRSEAR
jgi:hypothetical protein